METKVRQLRSPVSLSTPLCLVCGVDSGPIKVFLAFVMGGLVLAAVCLLFWAIGSKRIQMNEGDASLAIEAEKRKG
jgi:hypothetical protein